MTSFIFNRIGQAALTWMLIVTATFLLLQFAPGGPAIMMNPDLTPEAREQISRQLGLDQPVAVQYWRWLSSLLSGDLGISFSDRAPVWALIGTALPNTLQLSLAALLLTILLGIPLGVLAALRHQTVIDQVISVVAFLGLSIPAFWFGIVLILVFAVNLGWLPAAGMRTIGMPFALPDFLRHLIMPVAVLALANLAVVTRYTRSSMLNVLGEDFIRTARAKGLPPGRVTYRHAFRNALIPVVTVIGLRLPTLFGGTVITESVFAWPGMGRMSVSAALERDYPLVMGITVVMATVVLLVNLLIDLSYSYIDPRVRYD